MLRSLSYARLGRKDEVRAVSEILSQSFAFPAADALPWLTKAGLGNVRVLRDGRTPIACLLLLPMGQWFGGRSVPMTGVAAVGVAPHERGRGAARAIMTGTLRELRERGIALSTLYPATQTLYRKVGYEQAGGRYEITIPVGGIGDLRGTPRAEVRPLEGRDDAGVKEAYGRQAMRSPGWLDRGEYVWNRVQGPRSETANGYCVPGPKGIEGYVYVVRRRVDSGKHALVLTDLVASTARAGRRLLVFLSEHRSLATTVTFYGGPAHPLLSVLPEQTYGVRLDLHWMIRIVDLARALEARGWPEGLEGEIALRVTDDVLPDNAGRWRLVVAKGRATVQPGGRGGLELDIRALASLYSGYLSAASLVALGRVRGSERDVSLADALFAGPAPSMPDMF